MSFFGFGTGFGRMGNSFRDDEANARDKDRANQKRRKVIRSAHEPLIPFFCKILFICMITAPMLDVLMELVTHFRGTNPMRGAQFAVTLSWSILVIWLFFGIILLILADIQLIRTVKYGYVDRVYYFEDEIPKGEMLSHYEQVEQTEIDPQRDADLILYTKPVSYSTKKKYLVYVITAGGGALILALIYYICLRAAG